MPQQASIIISKLGVHAVASPAADHVRGLLCLKVTIPRESEGRQGCRLALFPSTPPRLLSIPALYPLPIPLSLLRSSTASNLTVASSLLALPASTSYPPVSHPSPGARPYIDTSKSTGQVYIVVDPISANRRSSGRVEGKSEWLVVVEFEVDLSGRADEMLKIVVPLPKCLDNVIRLKILPPSPSSTAEVSVKTEPKLLALPATAFASSLPRAGRIGGEEDWEDGEDPAVIAEEQEMDDEDDGEGSWLEGKFQSTEMLRLEWTYSAPQPPPIPTLRVQPIWDRRRPTIAVTYEAQVASTSALTLDASLPTGWGWSEILIHADNLVSWRADTGLEWRSQQDDTQDPDDSFSTVVSGRSGRSGRRSSMSFGKAMEQSLPSSPDELPADDFSFEVSGLTSGPAPPSRPGTPIARRPLGGSGPAERPREAVVRPARPTAAHAFDLELEDGDEDVVVLLQGTLMPLPLTMVPSDTPISSPTIRIEGGSSACALTIRSETRTIDTGDNCEIDWLDASGRPVLTRHAEPVQGVVRVRSQRSAWGLQTLKISIPSSSRHGGQVAFQIPQVNTVRIIKATSGTTALNRCVIEDEHGVEIRIESRKGGDARCEVELEVESEQVVALPVFKNGKGSLELELGDGWEGLVSALRTGMTRTAPSKFTSPLSSPATIPLPSGGKARRGAVLVFSWTALYHLALLWLVLSAAQQVQRLRNDVAYVVDDSRDLRLYVMEHAAWAEQRWAEASNAHVQHTPVHTGAASDGPGLGAQRDHARAQPGVVLQQPHGLSRVVFGSHGWDQWAYHPTVRTVVSTLQWVWDAVRWLVASP
ncbi:hypothetical protein Q5752_001651 [Cryptotrichosporon argae]